MYTYMININIVGVIVKNKINYAMQIPKKLYLRTLREVDYENVFFINVEIAKPERHSTNWVKKVVTFTAITLISLAGSFTSLVNYVESEVFIKSKSIELKLSNDIITGRKGVISVEHSRF